jgi:hypothetical protein
MPWYPYGYPCGFSEENREKLVRRELSVFELLDDLSRSD